MSLNDRPYAEKRDLHIGGVAPRPAPGGGQQEASVALEETGSHNQWGIESWGNDDEESDAMENNSREGDDKDGHPADSHQWIGDTWLGDAWDTDAGDSLLADAKLALTLADDYVRARPWQSLAVAALVGLAVGYGLAAASRR